MDDRKPTLVDIFLLTDKEKKTVQAIKELLDGLTVESVERILANVQLAKAKAIFHADVEQQ